MTAIIVRRMESGKFSVWEFWKRRASRICPALLAAVFLVMLVCYFIQIPHTYKETSREALRGLLFISNFWFARDEGYFTTSVLDKALLHTWSLSVEWQFYLLYPLLLVLWGKVFSLRTLPHFVTVMCAVSLTLSFIFSQSDSAYFMLHVRAWELLLGGIIFLLPPLKLSSAPARVLELAALTIIFLNIMLAKPMQGWNALSVLPAVAATAFILWLNIERSCLSNVMFQFTGRISYSMYLIHWPVIVISAKLNLIQHFIPITAFIVTYAALSYRFIETRRHWHWSILLLYFSLIAFSQYESGQKGRTIFNQSLPDDSYHYLFYGGRGIPAEGKISTGPLAGQHEMIVAGDSYARQYANYLNKEIPYIAIFCDGQIHFNRLYAAADQQIEKLSTKFYFKNLTQVLHSDSSSRLLIAHNWFSHINKEQFTSAPGVSPSKRLELVCRSLLDLADAYPQRHIFVVGQTVDFTYILSDCPLLKAHPHAVIRGMFSWLECPQTKQADYSNVDWVNQKLSATCKERSNLHFIDPNSAICNEDGECKVTIGKQLTFSDGWHLSLNGAEVVGSYILQQIAAIDPSFDYQDKDKDQAPKQ